MDKRKNENTLMLPSQSLTLPSFQLSSELLTILTLLKQPNILFIITDQQSNRALSCSGNPYLHTPQIDALATSGICFDYSYCATPVCGSSRTSVATGRLPHENGVLINSMSILPNIPTLGEIFRAGGYHTAWTCRWHMSSTALL